MVIASYNILHTNKRRHAKFILPTNFSRMNAAELSAVKSLHIGQQRTSPGNQQQQQEEEEEEDKTLKHQQLKNYAANSTKVGHERHK